jgi:homoserine O-acetyltransferase/O-succinyltransferase
VSSVEQRTGAWRDGDPVGRRRFVDIGTVPLERGGEVPDVRMAYECWGELDAEAGNAVLILHALTGDSHVVGRAEPGHPTDGWWEGMVGPGCPIDTDRWFVVAPNVLGGCQGTTGPASDAPDGQPWGSRFPYLTARDQVEAERRLADQLGIDTWAAVLGGSMGGMRVLEWAVMHPERVRGIVPIAVGAVASADQIALQSIQIQAIHADPAYRGGDYLRSDDGVPPLGGLALARRLAHWSYRSREELAGRFGRDGQGEEEPLSFDGRFAVQSYLDHHGGKLVRRFDAASYVVLTESMNSHDIGRDRGGAAPALARYQGEVVVVGIDSDRLYPLDEQHELAALLPGAERAAVISSPHGHDSFLIEIEAVGDVVAELLARVG